MVGGPTPARQAAHDVLLRVSTQGAFASRLLDSVLERRDLPPRERAFATLLIYETLRRTGELKARLQGHLRRPWKDLPASVQVALLLGACQLMCTRVPPHSAIDQSVHLVRRFGRLRAVVNAVLRRLAEEGGLPDPTTVAPDTLNGHHDPVGRIAPSERDGDALAQAATLGAHPIWAVREVAQALGNAEALAWIRANNATPPVPIRVVVPPPQAGTRPAAASHKAAPQGAGPSEQVPDGATQADSTGGASAPARQAAGDRTHHGTAMEHGVAVVRRLQATGADVQPHPLVSGCLLLRRAGKISHLPGFAQGHFTVQDPAAVLLGLWAAPGPGQRVIDVCAAPGGKALHLAEMMGGGGQVVALDVHPGKVARMAQAAARLRLPNVVTAVADATEPGALAAAVARNFAEGEMGRGKADHGRKKSNPALGDVIVVDAPCSGMGTLRRNPERRADDGSRVAALVALQRQILREAARCVAPGGALYYAVCTVTAAEGPLQAAAFCATHPDFAPAPPPARLAAFADGPYLRTWSHRHAMDSFFIAKFIRCADPGPSP